MHRERERQNLEIARQRVRTEHTYRTRSSVRNRAPPASCALETTRGRLPIYLISAKRTQTGHPLQVSARIALLLQSAQTLAIRRNYAGIGPVTLRALRASSLATEAEVAATFMF